MAAVSHDGFSEWSSSLHNNKNHIKAYIVNIFLLYNNNNNVLI